MNRYAKGGIAVAAGAVLLLGGFGTFALWNASTDLETGSVTSGELDITAGPVSGEWYVYNGTSTDPEDYSGPGLDLDDYTVVPEDELIYVAKGVELSAKGGELYYTLGIDLGAGGVDGDGFTIGTPELHEDSGDLPVATEATLGQYAAVAVGTPVYSVVASDGGLVSTYDVTVRVSFDADGTLNQNTELDLSEAAITVQQVIKN